MKKELITHIAAVILAMFSGTIMAEDSYVGINSIEGVYVEDSELDNIIGKGVRAATPGMPDVVSVILWDEKGGGKNRTNYESMSGTGNVQNVNLRMDRN